MDSAGDGSGRGSGRESSTVDRPVTLITGASSGIGRELALLAARDSRVLVLTARREERLRALAGELTTMTGDLEVLVLPADLTREEERGGCWRSWRGEGWWSTTL